MIADWLDSLHFWVDGKPIAKQSTRFDGHGRAHTPPRVKAWQEQVSIAARQAVQFHQPISGPVAMKLTFVLPDNHRVDLDNLSKAVCDALNGVIYLDDSQVVNLHLVKVVVKNAPSPGVFVEVAPGTASGDR